MARLLDGIKVAEQSKQALRKEIEELRRRGITPGLAAVLVGTDPASAAYVRNKIKACDELAIYSETHRLSSEINEEQILELITSLNSSEKIHGILVQLPLPEQLDENLIIDAIAPAKDVDGLHPMNQGLLLAGRPAHVPCTPRGVQELLHRSGIATAGRHVVIVGRSRLVGMPLAALLAQKCDRGNATVTICHSKSEHLEAITRQADILVAAIGKPRFVTANMIKHDAIIIDVGINRVNDPTSTRGYRLVGDVDFEGVQHIAKAITPVPGGVGPMTIAMLLQNTILAVKQQMRQ
jgi:methylenetetrahydrofolate dehydrogenase (NADP+)/methenyltetrahydrofolate cyclohydrolase